jgi:hypothetical protein
MIETVSGGNHLEFLILNPATPIEVIDRHVKRMLTAHKLSSGGEINNIRVSGITYADLRVEHMN